MSDGARRGRLGRWAEEKEEQEEKNNNIKKDLDEWLFHWEKKEKESVRRN